MCSEPRAAVGGRAAGCGRPTASALGVAYVPLLSFRFSLAAQVSSRPIMSAVDPGPVIPMPVGLRFHSLAS